MISKSEFIVRVTQRFIIFTHQNFFFCLLAKKNKVKNTNTVVLIYFSGAFERKSPQVFKR